VPKLELSPMAKGDLADIRDYSAVHFGENVAYEYVRGFAEAFDRLIAFPKIGTVVPNVSGERRMLSHRSHYIFYRLIDDSVWIIRILHKARDAEAALN
jgi:toxin ParE1/3/4